MRIYLELICEILEYIQIFLADIVLFYQAFLDIYISILRIK